MKQPRSHPGGAMPFSHTDASTHLRPGFSGTGRELCLAIGHQADQGLQLDRGGWSGGKLALGEEKWEIQQTNS